MRSQISKCLTWTGYKLFRLDVADKWSWLRETMSWTAAQRAQWRLSRLGDVIEFAWNEVPFYREFWGDHGLQGRRPKAIEELEMYPVLSKDIFRANSERLKPGCLRRIRHMQRHTGGSTSVPVHYNLDLEVWSLMEAFHLWGWSQAGYKFGDAVGVIAGGSLVPERMTLKSWARSFSLRRLFLYGVAMDAQLAREYHSRLTHFKAEYLYGYPSIMYLFAKNLWEQGLKLPRLKAVVTTAEMLQPQYRRGIENWLGCKVFDDYGSNDGGVESYECSLHDGFHYNDLQSILEVESSGRNDFEGNLLVTNLWNRSTPFIRYQNGDRVTLANSQCSCGAPFPLISSVKGRTTEILTFCNGSSLSGPALTLIFGDMDIDGWQIVQTGKAELDIRMMAQRDIPQEYYDRIHRVLNLHLNGQVKINIRRVAQLESTKGGKLRPIWTLLEQDTTDVQNEQC